MSEHPRAGALERNSDLVVASVYERDVAARIDSVWENVFDWEHLPWLHAQAFSSIELRASGAWGWQAEVGFTGEARAEIELVVDRQAKRYVARTLEGPGAPGEIWTALDPIASDCTRIRVEFCVSTLPRAALEKVGAAYTALYTGLWDQDEEMMQTRERAFAERAEAGGAGDDRVDLGPWDELAARLPLLIEFAGHRFRVVDLGGQPVAHSVECPHWLGPLVDCPVEAGVLTCPWHGYRFDVSTGRSVEGRSLRLRPAPVLEVDGRTGRVRMAEGSGAENATEA